MPGDACGSIAVSIGRESGASLHREGDGRKSSGSHGDPQLSSILSPVLELRCVKPEGAHRFHRFT